MNGLTMCFNDVFANGQSQTSAASVPASCRIRPVEPLEYAVKMFLFYAYAIVADLNQDMFFVCFINACCDKTIEFAVFAGIFCQVDKHHPYLFFISKNSDRRFTTFFYACPHTFFPYFDRQGFK